jgi:hypothetical protein
VPGFCLTLSLLIAYSNLRRSLISEWTGRILLILMLVAGIRNYRSTEPVLDVGWAETVRQIRDYQAGKRKEVHRAILPGNWTIDLAP